MQFLVCGLIKRGSGGGCICDGDDSSDRRSIRQKEDSPAWGEQIGLMKKAGRKKVGGFGRSLGISGYASGF